ncbi:NAD(P)/FAD-dependent oxidoreductase [Streptomyces sp. NPDC004244]
MTIPNHFRKPYGPGWVLVGDAGYLKDPITAQGIQDAFRDAERCTRALDDVLVGRRPFDEAMRACQEARDSEVMGMYEFTADFAMLEPPPPELQELLLAVSRSRSAGRVRPSDGRRDAAGGVLRTHAGTHGTPGASRRLFRELTSPNEIAPCHRARMLRSRTRVRLPCQSKRTGS